MTPAEPGSKPTADSIEVHLDAASATDPFGVPASIFEAVAGIYTQLGIR